jgi:hypothetical protein
MDDRIMSGAMLVALGTVFGAFGVWQLAMAYRTTGTGAWVEKAVQGASGVMVAGLFVDLAARLCS